ncbi:hypothetical protein [Methylocystis parvus]|uniref:hypothetical protein n=1 Tax=Methylocystis parvus TaxID=134 RepID=UPI003C746DDC
MQPDPIGYAGGRSYFSYAGASSLAKVDPRGLNPALGCVVGAWAGPLGCGVGAGIGAAILGGTALAATSVLAMKSKEILDVISAVTASADDIESFVRRLDMNIERSAIRKDKLFYGTADIIGVRLHFVSSKSNGFINLDFIPIDTLVLSNHEMELLSEKDFKVERSNRTNGSWYSKDIGNFRVGLSFSNGTNSVVGFFCRQKQIDA